ncbi:MAG: ACP phosphodiesterase [Chitinophagaceae bacterium]
MNYLAHAYLSFNNPETVVGNLISDFVKGKKKFDFSIGIQKGIQLHRAIDDFTDNHPATKEAKEIFRPQYRLYAGAFVDVVYDHYLATDTNEFSPESLLNFSLKVYEQLTPFLPTLPENFQQIFPYMRQHNWLNNYQYNWAIERSMKGLVRRATYISEADTAFFLFESNYQHLKDCYQHFFPALKSFATQQWMAEQNL